MSSLTLPQVFAFNRVPCFLGTVIYSVCSDRVPVVASSGVLWAGADGRMWTSFDRVVAPIERWQQLSLFVHDRCKLGTICSDSKPNDMLSLLPTAGSRDTSEKRVPD
jgi:hypothetical protein